MLTVVIQSDIEKWGPDWRILTNTKEDKNSQSLEKHRVCHILVIFGCVLVKYLPGLNSSCYVQQAKVRNYRRKAQGVPEFPGIQKKKKPQAQNANYTVATNKRMSKQWQFNNKCSCQESPSISPTQHTKSTQRRFLDNNNKKLTFTST